MNPGTFEALAAAHPFPPAPQRPAMAVGQTWRRRDGGVTKIMADRGDAAHAGWRWALLNSDIANENGRVGWDDFDSPGDLVELIQPELRE